jgi:hypothetical protein
MASMRPFETKRIIEAEGRHLRGSRWGCGACRRRRWHRVPASRTFGRVSVLHNNVGIVGVGSTDETTEES